MKVQDEMKRFLADTPGIDLVAFGDLSSGLILNSASNTACPREVLDLLGEKAAACFALLHAQGLPQAAAHATSVIHFSQTGSRVFARPSATADDVLCAVAEPGARLEPLLHATTGLARKVAGAP